MRVALFSSLIAVLAATACTTSGGLQRTDPCYDSDPSRVLECRRTVESSRDERDRDFETLHEEAERHHEQIQRDRPAGN